MGQVTEEAGIKVVEEATMERAGAAEPEGVLDVGPGVAREEQFQEGIVFLGGAEEDSAYQDRSKATSVSLATGNEPPLTENTAQPDATAEDEFRYL
jgi:hypothetical protein